MRVTIHPCEYDPFGIMVLHAESAADEAVLSRWFRADKAKWMFHQHSYGGSFRDHDVSLSIGFVDRAKWTARLRYDPWWRRAWRAIWAREGR